MLFIYLSGQVQAKTNFVSSLVEVLALDQCAQSARNTVTQFLLVGETDLAGIVHLRLK